MLVFYFLNDVFKFEIIDNNMCEIFNGVILETKSKLVIDMLEYIKKYVMTRMTIKRGYTKKWRCDCGPHKFAKVEK